MSRIITSLSFSDILDIHKEQERGCEYIVSANIPHRIGEGGIIQAPFYEKMVKGSPMYRIVPLWAFKKSLFNIRKGENALLVDVGYNNNQAIYARVLFKDLFQIYYSSSTSLKNQDHSLDELFSVRKIEP